MTSSSRSVPCASKTRVNALVARVPKDEVILAILRDAPFRALLRMRPIQNKFTPEGALRCRAVAAGLEDQSAKLHYGSVESGRKVGIAPLEVKELQDQPATATFRPLTTGY